MDPIIGGIIVGGALLGAGALGAPRTTPGGGEGWVWPMVRLADGRPPVISDGWGSDRDGGERKHRGVDVMYKRPRTLTREEWARMSVSERNHNSRGYEVPESAVIVAAHAGRIWSTSKTALGIHVLIDHGRGVGVTFYQHLARLDVPEHRGGKMVSGAPGRAVEAGTVLGLCGHSSRDAATIRHLHFEIWPGGTSASAVDPEARMKGWRVL